MGKIKITNIGINIWSERKILEYTQAKLEFEMYMSVVACHKSLDKHSRPRSDCFFRSSLISVFPVCCFVNSSPDNKTFDLKTEREVFKILEHLTGTLIGPMVFHVIDRTQLECTDH